MVRQANLLLVVLVSFLLAFWLRFGGEPLPSFYLIALLITLLVSSLVLPSMGLFREDLQLDYSRRLRRLLAGWSLILVILITLAASLKVTSLYSRIWFGSWVIISYLGLVLVMTLAHWDTKRGRGRRESQPIVLVGAGDAARRLELQIETQSQSGLEIKKRFGKAWNEHGCSPIEDLGDYVSSHSLQGVWIAIPWEEKSLLDKALAALRECAVDVKVVPDLHQYQLLNQTVSQWHGLPLISLASTPMTQGEERLKRVVDRLGSLLLILFLSPILFLIWLAVRLSSPGPAIFRQQRHGVGGEKINILKFRTMVVHQDPEGVSQARPGDQRITAVGRLLRRTSLDELPQLFNVLKGEMSLVGPRPHAIEHNEIFKSRIPRYMLRHRVLPGMTGWAQVNGYRGITDTPEKMALRIEHDLWYIQNWSVWLDVKILLMTPFVMMHRNAY